MRVWSHECPKCNGDLYREECLYGPHRVCANCGHRDVAAMVRVARPQRPAPRRLLRLPSVHIGLRRAA